MADTRVIDDTTLGAGETGCFALYTDIPDAQVARFTLGTGWSSSQLEVLRGDVVVQNIQQEADAVRDLRVRGQLRNAGTVNTTFNNVVLDVRDAQDRVIDCDFAFINGGSRAVLAPGQTDVFVNEHDIPFSSVTRIRAWAAWEEGDVGPTTPTAQPWSWRRLVSGARDVPVLGAKARARLRNAAIQRLR